MKSNSLLKTAPLEVVNNQLKNNDSVETRQTFDRLIREGISEEEAKRLIGCVVSAEVFDILKKKETFNRAR